MWGWGAGGWLAGLWMVLFWVGIVLLIVWAVRYATPDGGDRGRGRALDILEERYARGEIDTAELDARRRELTRS